MSLAAGSLSLTQCSLWPFHYLLTRFISRHSTELAILIRFISYNPFVKSNGYFKIPIFLFLLSSRKTMYCLLPHRSSLASLPASAVPLPFASSRGAGPACWRHRGCLCTEAFKMPTLGRWITLRHLLWTNELAKGPCYWIWTSCAVGKTVL